MNRREFITSTTAASVLGIQPWTGSPGRLAANPVAAAGALDLGQRAQLFIARHLVGREEGITYRVHQARKHPLNPLVRNDKAWEGWWVRILGGTVLYDQEEKCFKMWYFTVSDCFPKFGVLYATSRDGIEWDKPLVGLLECPGHARHNAILDHVEVASVMKDVRDPDPSRRYKMIACENVGIAPWPHSNSPHCYVSADGLRWKRLNQSPLFYSSDVLTAFFDRERQLYVAMPKVVTPVRGLRRRCFGMTTSPDLLAWSETRMVFIPDERDDAGSQRRIAVARDILGPDDPGLMRTEFYGISTYAAESCLVGFPWVFTVNNHLPSGKHSGVGEIQIAVTRDLQAWERPLRDPVVPHGPPGSWDCGFVTGSAHAIRFGDEVRLYYSGQNYSHGDPASKVDLGPERGAVRAIGLATWALDRFISVDGDSSGGRLTTVPVLVSGPRLELNIDAGRPGAQAVVRILDAEGRPVPGYESSEVITRDSLRQTVVWKGRRDLGKLKGKPVCVQVELRNASLFSLAFRA